MTMQRANPLQRIKALVCLATAISLSLPYPVFGQGSVPSDSGNQEHLRSVQVNDDPDTSTNPTLAGLEETLRQAGQKTTPSVEIPASINLLKAATPALVARTFWQARGQEVSNRPLALTSPRFATGLEEPSLPATFTPTEFTASLRPERIQQIEKLAGTIEQGGYDRTSGSRGVIIALPPGEWFVVEIAGRMTTVRAIKLVGVGFLNEAGQMIRPQALPYEAYQRSTLDIVFNSKGLLITQWVPPDPLGALLSEDAQTEIDISSYVLGQGIAVTVPLGHGVYPTLKLNGHTGGFKVLGLSDPQDSRFFMEDQKRSKKELWTLGRTLRALHDGGFAGNNPLAGVIHGGPHTGNFTVHNGEVGVTDLTDAKRKTDFTSVHEMLGNQYLDLLRARNSVIQDYGAEAETPFLQGYFYDRGDKVNPSELDWGLIRWTGWTFFGEATRTPFGWIRSPIVELIQAINPAAVIPPKPGPTVDTVARTFAADRDLHRTAEGLTPEWSQLYKATQFPENFRGDFVVPIPSLSPQIHDDLALLEAESIAQRVQGRRVHIERVTRDQDMMSWIEGVLLSYARAAFQGHLGVVLGVVARSEYPNFEQDLEQLRQRLEREYPQYRSGWDRMRDRISFIWTYLEDLHAPEGQEARASYFQWFNTWVENPNRSFIHMDIPLIYPPEVWQQLDQKVRDAARLLLSA